MDLLGDFLNRDKFFEPVRVPTAQVDGRIYNSEDEEESSDEHDGTCNENADYAEEYRKAEDKIYASGIRAQEDRELFGVDGAAAVDVEPQFQQLKESVMLEVFHKYPFDNKLKSESLTIEAYRAEIISYLKTNSVVIIQGPTGCGKTTQVPQYILDDCRQNNVYCNIAVTQPRRIAAISVARRVCEERGWALGTVCGYQVGLERNRSPDTVLSYITTGVLLQALIQAKSLHNYTHIIIDEVHERTQEMDFLLLLIRKFLYTNSLSIKVILMSATFETSKFTYYFRNNSRDVVIFPPRVFITKENKYNVQVYYLDQLSALGKIPNFSFDEPQIDNSLYDILVYLIRIFDRLDKENAEGEKIIGSVLVFLPGIYEIEEAYRSLTEKSKQVDYNQKSLVEWYILPLHSSITNDEQKKVFIAAKPGQRKIILSTNIAESSITVSDIVYVIDFCLTKSMIVNFETQYQSLQLQWASRVNCTQRTGRVGRVMDGRVYRFVPRSFYEDTMNQDITPEILRAPLERVVLASKLLDFNEPPEAILALAIDPPNLSNIQSTVWALKECGGLSVLCRGIQMMSDGDLTFLGRVMAGLPLNVNLSKLIFLGHIFSCLNDCIIMAAGSSLSNVFSSPFQERLSAYMNRLQWADGSASDLIAYLNLYKVWDKKKRSNAFHQKSTERMWARQNFINLRALNEWAILVHELSERLKRLGIEETVGPGRVKLADHEAPSVLKVVICGAFYPNYFIRSSDGGQVDEREAVKILGGRDPCKTVYFQQMDSTQPGPLYAKRIKELFPFCSVKINVYFDHSFKVYVEFNQSGTTEIVSVDGRQFVTSMPGKIRKEVYCAVRRRQLRMRNTISCMGAKDSWKYAKDLGISEKSSTGFYSMIRRPGYREMSTNSILPSLDTQYIKIMVSLFIDAGHFWAQNIDDQTCENVRKIQQHLNKAPKSAATGSNTGLVPVDKKAVSVGDLCTAQYDGDKMYYRCRIISFSPSVQQNKQAAQILFIDYGNIQEVQVENLYCLPSELKDIPAQAMECILSEVQPSLVLSPRALWSDQANAVFERYTQNVDLYGKVYSVVNNVVHLELYHNIPTQVNRSGVVNKSINEIIIEKGLAQRAEESYLSKENHVKRQNLQNYETSDLDIVVSDQNSSETIDVEPPPRFSCNRSFELKGPYSPLEMQIYSVLQNGLQKLVTVEGTSVNAVLLDTDPQDPHERLIVSSGVCQSAHTNNLVLRDTTVMPNIHGLPMLMALIFCPTMEPKPTKDGSRFGAILCGLGSFKDSKKSMYAAHDMTLTLDTELTQDTLSEVNEIRYWMNLTVRSMESTYNEIAPSVDIEICQMEIKNRLFNLLRKQNRSQERSYVKNVHIWREFSYIGDILEAGEHDFMQNEIWPLHWTMTLKNESEEKIAIKQNLTEMSDYAMKTKTMSETTCRICNVNLYSVAEVRLHLVSAGHLEKVKAEVPDYKND